MIIFTGRLGDLLVMDKQRFAYFSLLAPKAPGRFRSGHESGRVFGPYGVPARPAIQVTTGLGVELSEVASENPQRAPSACEPFHEFVALGLSRGRNSMTIWQDLVAETGFRGGYGTVKRFVRKLRGNQPLPRSSENVVLTD
jgi:hypothetical protein